VSPAALLSQTRAHLRDPLYRNAYALMASTIITSVLGVAFWVAAARLYPAETVGRDTALILAMQGLALVGQLNLGTAVVRFLPQIRRRARRGVAAVYAVSACGVLALSTLFVIGGPRVADDFRFLEGEPRLAVGYALAVVLWVIFVLQDQVLTALRRTGWVPVENAIYGALKLVVLVALATSALAGHGILVAWIVPAALIVPVMTWLIFVRLLPQHAASHREGPSPLEAHGTRKLVRFLGQDYLGSVLGQASLLCLPLLVVALLGSTENAYFAIPFALAMAFDLLFLNGATSLTVEGAHDENAARDLTRRLVRRVFGPLAAIGVLSAVAAPLLLWPFGPDYVRESASVLRLLLLACLFRATIFLFIAVMRLRRHSGWIMGLEGSLFVLLLCSTLVLAPRFGREGVGLAWLIANGAVALAVAPWIVRFMRATDDAPEAPPLRLVTSMPARLLRAGGGRGAVAASRSRTRPPLPLVAVALGTSVLTPLAVLAGLTGPVTFVLVLGMFLLAPGTALVGWLRPDGVGAGLGLIVGTSLATTTVAAQGMLSSGFWSPTAGLCVLSVACAVPLQRQLRSGLAARRAVAASAEVEERTAPVSVSIVAAAGVSGVALRTSLRSILATDLGDVQVIVVDRHPDSVRTVEAVAGFADPRLLYTCAPSDTLSAARDAGMRVATGDLVVMAVPDSIVHEGWLEALIAPFRDPRIGCVVGRLPERGARLTEEELEDAEALDLTDLLWPGDRPIAFATRRDVTRSPAVAYAPGALAWPALHREDELEELPA
jgi:O-antigen/teichoic acid export membrane protein